MIIRNVIGKHKSNLKKKKINIKSNILQNYSYNEQGITLIALVVTIILLLILSSIVISTSKQNNLITNAKESSKKYSASQIDEKIDLAQQNIIAEGAGYDYSIKDLVEEVKKENENIFTVIVDESDDGKKSTYIIDKYFYEFTKKDDGIIIYNRKGDASDKDKEKYTNKQELKNLKKGIITFKNDKTNWTNENVNVTIVAKTEDKSVQEKINNGTYFVVSTVNDAKKLTTLTKSITSQTATNQGDTIYACLTDGYGTYVATATEKIENIDKTKPTDTAPIAVATTNTITITNKQEDKPGETETKASGIVKTEYSNDGGNTWQISNVFSGLPQNTQYTIKTKVTDKAGNVTESQKLSVATETISKVGEAVASPTGWTNQDVTVTLPTQDGFTTKYTTDGTEPSASSTTYSSPFKVSLNCTVLYIYTDGTNINRAGTLAITNIDKTAPTNTAPTATTTANSITVTNKQTDNGGSGIKTVEYSKDNGATWQSSNIFGNLTSNQSYTIQTRTTDNAGNVTNSISATVTTNKGKFTVTLAKGSNIKSVSGAGTYTEGDKVTVSAALADNYTESNWVGQTAETEGNVRYKNTHSYSFNSWTGTYSSSSQTYTFTMPKENVNLTANGNENITQTNKQRYQKMTAVPNTIYVSLCQGTSFNIYNCHSWLTFINNGAFPAGDGINNQYIVTGSGRYIWLAYQNGTLNYATNTANYIGYVTLRISLNSDHSNYADKTIYAYQEGSNPVKIMTSFNYVWESI